MTAPKPSTKRPPRPASERSWDSPSKMAVLHHPTASKPYFRMDYRDLNGQRHQPSAGTDFDAAYDLLLKKDAELTAGLGEKGSKPFRDVVDSFLVQAKEKYASSTFEKQERMAANYIIPKLGHIEAWALTRSDVKKCLDSAKAVSAKRHLRATMGSLLTWAFEDESITKPRAMFIAKLSNTGKSKKGRQQGTTVHFIEESYRPSAESCRLLAETLLEVLGGVEGEKAWLMVAVASASGVRLDELAAIRRSDFVRGGKFHGKLRVRRQATRPKGKKVPGKKRRVGGVVETPPKWGMPRDTVWTDNTIWGAPLAERLWAWLDAMPDDCEIDAPEWYDEPHRGKAPWLVFPTKEGCYLTPSNFERDMIGETRKLLPEPDEEHGIVGWKGCTCKNVPAGKGHSCTAWTWHSLRHAYASWHVAKGTPMLVLSKSMGHKNEHTTSTMYVGATEDSTDALRQPSSTAVGAA